MVQVAVKTQLNKVVEYLLLRQHISPLAPGHHQVSTCDFNNHDHVTHRVYRLHIPYNLDFIILASPDNHQWSRYQRDLVGCY